MQSVQGVVLVKIICQHVVNCSEDGSIRLVRSPYPVVGEKAFRRQKKISIIKIWIFRGVVSVLNAELTRNSAPEKKEKRSIIHARF